MYVCKKCGNYKSFTVSIPETVTNKIVRIWGREYETEKYEEQTLFIKNSCEMQEIEETMVCNECESMGVVDVESEHLDTELLRLLMIDLKGGFLSKKLMKIMKKEASKVGDQEGLETENH